jgi:predicted dehydrogenase
MAGLAAASVLAPSALRGADAGEGDRKIGYCPVGLGRISVDHFMPGLLQSKHGKVTGLVSGSPDKARKLAAQYGVPASSIYTYEQYDRIRDNPAIDAVYIGLPNSMHAEYTIRAAKAGKHVLCEKPMCTSVEDARAMIAACDAAQKKLMIAYRCQLEPVNLKAIALIRSGAIGQVQAIESANGFNIRAGEWRLNKQLAGGGPLMDVGIYSLNASRYLTGEEPQVLSAYSSVIDHDGRFNEVEENVGWTMKFPSGIVVSCNTTYGANMDGYYKVHGSKGVIELSPAFGYDGIHLRAQIAKADDIDMPTPLKDPQQFTLEGDYFADCIFNDKPVKMSGQEGLRDMELMMRIYRAAGVKTA